MGGEDEMEMIKDLPEGLRRALSLPRPYKEGNIIEQCVLGHIRLETTSNIEVLIIRSSMTKKSIILFLFQ